MAQMTTQDIQDLYFNLSLEITDDGYRTRLLSSPAGRAAEPFRIPLSGPELQQFWAAARGEGAAPAARRLGEQLFAALFCGSVGAALRASLAIAYQERARLRVHLALADAPDLLHLPWEYLYDPVRSEHLSLSTHAPLARYAGLMHQLLPLKAPTPLRMLVVVANPATHSPLNVDREWLGLVDALDYLALERKLILERLQRPTLLELQRSLRQGEYHIFHFIGHSIFDVEAQEGMLVFEDEMRRGRLVSGRHLGMLLRDHFPMRLAVLQSCDGQQTLYNAPLTLAANTLVQRGLPAALSLPFALPEAFKLPFLGMFYDGVAARTPVDLAMVRARTAAQNGPHGGLWGAPLLFSRCADGVLFGDDAPPARPAGHAKEPSLLERVMRLR